MPKLVNIKQTLQRCLKKKKTYSFSHLGVHHRTVIAIFSHANKGGEFVSALGFGHGIT